MAAICSLRIVCAARAPKVAAAADDKAPEPPKLKAGSKYKDLTAAVDAGLVTVRPPALVLGVGLGGIGVIDSGQESLKRVGCRCRV